MSKSSQKPAAPQQPQNRKIKVELPRNLDSTYANFAVITHSFSEIIVDFATVMPNAPQARVQNRIVMTPANAKLLHRALGENLARFEGQNGEIKLPPGGSLADLLFRPPSPGQPGQQNPPQTPPSSDE